MHSVFDILSRKRGLSPGVITDPDERPKAPPTIEVIEFSATVCEKHAVATPADAIQRVKPDRVTWINIDGLWDSNLLHEFGNLLEIHPLLVEDIGTPIQRPKLEEQEDHLLAVVRLVSLGSEDPLSTSETQVSLLLREHLVVTFREGRCGGAFDSVRGRIEANRGRIRRADASYLFYALLDSLVDQSFVLLAAVEDRIVNLEERVETNQNMPDIAAETLPLRRAISTLKRAAAPARDMLGNLVRCDSTLIADSVRPFLQDVQEHGVHVVEGADTVRDSLNAVLEAHRSAVGMRTNEVMRVLTIIASVFIPITFVAGVYGMNFELMPELRSPWGYPVVLGVMGCLAGGMLWFFRKRGWL